jgi:hypothetical protein
MHFKSVYKKFSAAIGKFLCAHMKPVCISVTKQAYASQNKRGDLIVG